MNYTVSVDKLAQKFLNALTDKRLYQRLSLAIEDLAKNPRPQGSVKLKGSSYHRIRVGNYRIIYQVKDKILVVLVVSIGHRRDVYR